MSNSVFNSLGAPPPAFARAWRAKIESDLTGNVLPFWLAHAIDARTGAATGGLSNDLRLIPQMPHSAVLSARILWTFARAYGVYGRPDYLALARRTLSYITLGLLDHHFRGSYWSLGDDWRPRDERKLTYAQAFMIYGLSEFARVAHDAESLHLALELFSRLEQHAHDAAHGGYIEGCSRTWKPLDDVRLSAKEPRSRKSMNTLLHVMEALASLAAVSDHPAVRARLAELVRLFLDRIVDPESGQQRLFFEDDWRVVAGSEQRESAGHDIETSWLLVECAAPLRDQELKERSRTAALSLAKSACRHLRSDGGFQHGAAGEPIEWWPQAEAIIGFYNAYQLSGESQFVQAALNCWNFVERHFIDRQDGDWFKVLAADLSPVPDQPKIGPWHCPYHHARMGFEMLSRLQG